MNGVKSLNPHYLSGFVSGEGSFVVALTKHKTKKLGCDAVLTFEIEMRVDDREIVERIQKTLDCGNIYVLNYERYKKWAPHVKYKVQKRSDIFEKIIPFFKKYPLENKKKYDFELFCEAADIFRQGRHLVSEGLEELLEIKSRMNKFKPHLVQGSARVRENRAPGGEGSIQGDL